MHGDVKGAFLCEASEDDLVGGELVTNGTFDTDIAGWTVDLGGGGGSVVFDTGEIKVTQVTSVYMGASRTIDVTGLDTVVLVAERTSASAGGGRSRIGLNTIAGAAVTPNVGFVEWNGVETGSLTKTIDVSAYTTLYVVISDGSTNSIVTTFDNISVKLANEDRSVNNNGLAVNGTITVAPVETGAETMAYSGFSASNYLSQPYNSDLDFTDTMNVMFWIKGVVDGDDVFTRGARGVDLSYGVYIDAQADMRFYASTDGTTHTDFDMPFSETTVWEHVAFVMKGLDVYGYRNGVSAGKLGTLGGNLYSQATDKNPLLIGTPAINDAFTGSLSRLRIGAGAPTPEQIKKIYRDELPLYREDAACTINGTSSAVTAMASDPVTGLLQVGTSGGLSAFRGLQRVEQDTTAVTTTISANGATVARQ